MTKLQWVKLLNEYNEIREMVEYFRDKGDSEQQQSVYTGKMYMLETAISIFENKELCFLTTQIYKGKDVLTVIKIYENGTFDDKDLYLEYFPVVEHLVLGSIN